MAWTVFTLAQFSENSPGSEDLIAGYNENSLIIMGEEYSTLTTSGNWIVPTGWTKIELVLIGGGGGGAGGAPANGGGGGSSGIVKTLKVSVTPGASEAYTIGTGGGGGALNTNGTTGGTTSILGHNGWGGQGGFASGSPGFSYFNGFCLSGGTGGNASISAKTSINAGDAVRRGSIATAGGTYGGGAGGPCGVNFNCANAWDYLGNGGVGGNDGVTGFPATSYGAGGGGGSRNNTGGNGSPGIILYRQVG